MSIENIRQFIKEKAEQFGAKTDNEFNKPYVQATPKVKVEFDVVGCGNYSHLSCFIHQK